MNSIKNCIKKVIKYLRIISSIIVLRIVQLFTKVKNNRVLFLSDVRDHLDGNLKFIYDELDENKCEKILCFKKDRKEKRKLSDSIKVVKYLTTSKYIMLDDYSRLITLLKPKKGQEICQLWHGPGAFKKFGYSRTDNKIDKYSSHKNYTKVCVTSEEIRGCYAEGFGVDIENVKATGMARMDVLFDEEYKKQKREELCEKYPYLKGKKVILFAPTYRGNSLSNAYYDFEKLDLDKIYKKFKDENYVFIFKWHPGLYYKMNKEGNKPYDFDKYKDFFYDLSDIRDVNDFLIITDVLITDYSSIIFDYAILNKPIVYFTYDLDEYNSDRGLYYDFSEYVYGKVAVDTDELIEAISSHELMVDKRKKFIDKFLKSCDGHAVENTCKWIFEDNLDFLKNRGKYE